jgi:geranylgeranyl pyrophosphate synthase
MPYRDAAVEEVIDIVRSGGYAAVALADARRRLETASQAADALPRIEARTVLKGLGSYLVDRVDSIQS